MIPNIFKGLSLSFELSLKQLNKMIPIEAITPILIFCIPNLTDSSLTREQKTPTNMTESKLQDFIIIATENEE